MAIFSHFPRPEHCLPGKPKGKKEKLLNEIATEMLFPTNQPHWQEAGENGRSGMTIRLNKIRSAEDFQLVEKELVQSGWWIDHIKYRDHRTFLVLADVKTVPLKDLNSPIIVKMFGGTSRGLTRTFVPTPLN